MARGQLRSARINTTTWTRPYSWNEVKEILTREAMREAGLDPIATRVYIRTLRRMCTGPSPEPGVVLVKVTDHDEKEGSPEYVVGTSVVVEMTRDEGE